VSNVCLAIETLAFELCIRLQGFFLVITGGFSVYNNLILSSSVNIWRLLISYGAKICFVIKKRPDL
jgi:hypothetical protein